MYFASAGAGTASKPAIVCPDGSIIAVATSPANAAAIVAAMNAQRGRAGDLVNVKRIASGDYETTDGRFRIYRIPDLNPPAWNVERIDPDWHDVSDPMIVDGAATKRDAVALLRQETS